MSSGLMPPLASSSLMPKFIDAASSPGLPGAIAAAKFEDEYTPALGQTVFLLTHEAAPSTAGGDAEDSIEFLVNDVGGYDDITDWTFTAPKTITWTDAKFSLDTGDKVRIRYIKK